ncbi:MAG: FkbM family methyltransferase, partial [Actinomycetota bacterium]|nr:FkbM family methyltransferase [Actinomycetota bacterium]
ARDAAARNSLGFRVEELAFADRRGEAPFYVAEGYATSSLRAGFRPAQSVVSVTVDTIDAWCSRTSVTPAVIKIDTESTEPAVLEGAAATLERARPWLLVEVLAGRVEEGLTRALESLGYAWYRIGEDVPYPARERIEGDPDHEHLMWLFTPDVPDSRFWPRVAEWRSALARCSPLR